MTPVPMHKEAINTDLLKKALEQRIDWTSAGDDLDSLVHDTAEACAIDRAPFSLLGEYAPDRDNLTGIDLPDDDERFDIWSQAASNINNYGITEQLDFLIRATGPHNTISALRAELMGTIPSELRVSAIDLVDYAARTDYAPLLPVVGDTSEVESVVVGLAPVDRRMLMEAHQARVPSGALPLTGFAIPMAHLDLARLEQAIGEPVQLSHLSDAPLKPLLSEHDPKVVREMPAVRAALSNSCNLTARVADGDVTFGFKVGQTKYEATPEPITRVLERQFSAARKQHEHHRLHA